MKLFVLGLLCSSVLGFSQEIPLEDVRPLEVSAQEFYGHLQEAMDEGDWWAVIDFGELVLYHFPDSPLGEEIPFFIGTAYYNLGQHELANAALTDYLKMATSPKRFEEAIQMKFAIAEFFKNGGKKRLFGSHKMPAILPAKEEALEIYDEVLTILPHHDIAARSLLSKAEIHACFEEFKPSIEVLQVMLRRFPKHELAAEAYLQISKVYLQQSKALYLDPDLLDLAEMNLRKFRAAFPRESRLEEAQQDLADMQEVFAKHLLETGEFFHKRRQFDASIIYFSKVIAKYPNTPAAVVAHEKLHTLQASGHF